MLKKLTDSSLSENTFRMLEARTWVGDWIDRHYSVPEIDQLVLRDGEENRAIVSRDRLGNWQWSMQSEADIYFVDVLLGDWVRAIAKKNPQKDSRNLRSEAITEMKRWSSVATSHAERIQWFEFQLIPEEAEEWVKQGISTLEYLELYRTGTNIFRKAEWLASGIEDGEIGMWFVWGFRSPTAAGRWANAGHNPESAIEYKSLGLHPMSTFEELRIAKMVSAISGSKVLGR